MAGGVQLQLRIASAIRGWALAILCWTVASAPILARAQAQTPATSVLYAAPDGAGDACTRRQPCALGVVQTRLRDIVRTTPAHAIAILLLPGAYRLSEPFALSGEDSAHGHSIRIAAATDQPTILSGGVAITDWQWADKARNIWSAPLPAGVKADPDTQTWPRLLLVAGQRAEPARLMINPPVAGAPRLGGARFDGGHGYAIAIPGMTDWGDPSSLEVVYTNAWTIVRCPVESVIAGHVSIQPECWNRAGLNYARKYGVGLNWLEGSRTFLTRPGQWALDRQARRVFYMARPGEDLRRTEAVLAVHEQLLTMVDAHDITVTGLRFTATDWHGYRGGAGDPRPYGYTAHQAGDDNKLKQQPRAAVEVVHSTGIRFDRDMFANLGGSGLTIRGGSSEITVSNGRFFMIGATSLQVGSPEELGETLPQRQNARLTIIGNRFFDNGFDYWDNAALMAFALRDSVLAHNELANCPWSCLALGWGWGKAASYNGNIAIESNYIHDGMQHLYDGGAIYTNGSTRGGNIVRNNVIDRIGTITAAACDMPGWARNFNGIYLDEGSDHYVLRGNLVTNIVPAAPAAAHDPRCRGYWLKVNSAADPTLDLNGTDYDLVALAHPAKPAAAGCRSPDQRTACGPGQSRTRRGPRMATGDWARGLRASAGPAGGPAAGP